MGNVIYTNIKIQCIEMCVRILFFLMVCVEMVCMLCCDICVCGAVPADVCLIRGRYIPHWDVYRAEYLMSSLLNCRFFFFANPHS